MAGTTKEPAVNPGDYDTPEQQIGRFNTTRPWESCITICQQWAWKPDDKLKSLEECVHTLVTCAGGDGNLLLNVGPMPTGEIEPRQVARLKEIGAWLAKFGTTIYETGAGRSRPGRGREHLPRQPGLSPRAEMAGRGAAPARPVAESPRQHTSGGRTRRSDGGEWRPRNPGGPR